MIRVPSDLDLSGGSCSLIGVNFPYVNYTKRTKAAGRHALNTNCLGVGAILVFIGLYFSWVLFNEQRRNRVITIELRGLNQTIDTPLVNAVPRRILGARDSMLIDVRNLVEGTDQQKKRAVDAVNNLPQLLAQKKDGRDRSDLVVYAGGLAPVPLLFLTGTLLASESTINWLDWDRKKLNWVSPTAA